MKISDFLKTHSFSIIFTFIDDFTLNSDNNKESFGLCWPLWPWINSLSKNWPLMIKITHN